MIYYKGGVIRALVDLFPEVPFDEKKFRTAPSSFCVLCVDSHIANLKQNQGSIGIIPVIEEIFLFN